MATYKLQVQSNEQRADEWHDVVGDNGEVLVFTNEATARTKLAELYPVLVRMEALGADRKRTRVVVANPYADIDKEKDE
jgi:hypothetical protein